MSKAMLNIYVRTITRRMEQGEELEDILSSEVNKYKNELPIGVRPQNKKYQAFCRDRIRGNTYLGTSDTPEGAFILYKIYKENLIKKTADEFKWCLPENVYTAMYNYEININD